jgi:hypothetical protein
MKTFEDYFSKQAGEYVRYRPRYPSELFDYLASITPARQLAWDCGTGNGQAALELVKHFKRVVATDASADQLARATPHERIDYRVERAEEVSLKPGSVDLITVAVAVHWFNFETFYQKVRRVGKEKSILAVWTYQLPVINPTIDKILNHYYREVLSGYWPERFHYVDECYCTLPFPFEELNPPQLEMKANWDLKKLVGFLDSWSATRRYQDERGEHPVKIVWQELSRVWGNPEERRKICWLLYLRIGYIR